MEQVPVKVDDVGGGVRVVTLDRPPANAIDETLLTSLDRAVEEVEHEDAVRAVVLTGQGRFFCAGFDLRAAPRSPEQVWRMIELYRSAHRRLLALPKPTLAAVNGHAVAGGLVLVLACDHRVVVDADATFGLNEVAIGAAYPTAALEVVRLRLAHPAANELLLGAELYPMKEMERFGIASTFAAPAAFDDAVMARARQLAEFPREVYADTKQRMVGDALARIDAVTLEDELVISALWTTEESAAARARQRQRL